MSSEQQQNNFVYHCPELWESPTTSKLNTAMVRFNADFEAIAKDGKSNRNKYATLDGIMNAVRPILAKHGLYVRQPISGGMVITMLCHESGEFTAAAMPYKPMSSNGTNDLQNAGGGFTYIKRYAISAMLAISTDADDDGASGGVTVPPSAKPAQQAAPPKQPLANLEAAKKEVLSIPVDAAYEAYAEIGKKFRPAPFFADLAQFISTTLDARGVKRPQKPAAAPQAKTDQL